MKKFLGMILAICLMASMLCLPASASADVISISGRTKGGKTVAIGSYTSFEKGWEAAIDYAEDGSYMDQNEFDRIVVDLLADWNANGDGEFGSGGDGFEWSTIHIPENVRIMINLNGHTVNRGLQKAELDGEVLYIDDKADVIINGGKHGDPVVKLGEADRGVKLGTITGGFSTNGAGGIHICSKATVSLNNVEISGNKVENDNGAGIALDSGATLIMSGGRLSNNELREGSFNNYVEMYGAGIYASDATVMLKDVLIQSNFGRNQALDRGAVVAAFDSTVSIRACEVLDNAIYEGDTRSVFYFSGCDLTVSNSTFKYNGYPAKYDEGNGRYYNLTVEPRSVFRLEDCALHMSECSFEKNNVLYLLNLKDTYIYIEHTDFTDDRSLAIIGTVKAGADNIIRYGKFNQGMSREDYSFAIDLGPNPDITFEHCDFGNAVLFGISPIASIFSNGPSTMIVSVAALVASLAAVGVSIASSKRKAFPTPTADETEDED